MATYPKASVSTNDVISVTDSSTALAAANANRSTVLLLNSSTDTTVYLAFGVAATTGDFPLPPGQSITLNTQQAIAGITASGTASVGVLEEAH